MFSRIRSEVIRGDVGKGHWISDKYRITTLLTERQRSLSERREYTLVESLRKFPPAAVEPRGRQSKECSSQCTYTLPLHPGHTRGCNKIYTACLYNTGHGRADSCSERQTHRSSDCHVALLFFIWSQRSAAEWHGC